MFYDESSEEDDWGSTKFTRLFIVSLKEIKLFDAPFFCFSLNEFAPNGDLISVLT